MSAPLDRSTARNGIKSDYSLEITARDVVGLEQVADAVPGGTQVSITFLPGEAWEGLVEAAASVQRLGFTPVPHIAARQLGSRSELEGFLASLSARAKIDRVFVIAGDVPNAKGPYADTLSIITSGALAMHGVKKVGISGYPDGHPAIDHDALWRALLEKRAALDELGLDFEIVTQFGFDADPFLNWIEKVRAAGIMQRIRIGIPGPASVKSLLHFAARCGVGASTKVLAKYGLSLTKLMGSAGPERLLSDLQKGLDPKVHGDVSIHLYPFGGVSRSVDFMRGFATVQTSDFNAGTM